MDETNQRIVETYVLFRRLCLMLDTHVELYRKTTMTAVEQAFQNGGPVESGLKLAAFNYASFFIDLVNRIRNTAESLRPSKLATRNPDFSRLKARAPEAKVFRKAVEGVVDVRNRFQHAQADVTNVDSDNMLGAIYWRKNSQLYVVALLDLTRERKSVAEWGPTLRDSEWVYTLNDRFLYLDRIYSACQAYCGFVGDVLHSYVQTLMRRTEGNRRDFDVSRRTELLVFQVSEELRMRGATVSFKIRNPAAAANR